MPILIILPWQLSVRWQFLLSKRSADNGSKKERKKKKPASSGKSQANVIDMTFQTLRCHPRRPSDPGPGPRSTPHTNPPHRSEKSPRRRERLR
uniref:Uncharacterized protein n=1 Tax=Aegilops tauschii subsp. strangulata TaxID=200361 RepID=A0A453PF69_AEGTS